MAPSPGPLQVLVIHWKTSCLGIVLPMNFSNQLIIDEDGRNWVPCYHTTRRQAQLPKETLSPSASSSVRKQCSIAAFFHYPSRGITPGSLDEHRLPCFLFSHSVPRSTFPTAPLRIGRFTKVRCHSTAILCINDHQVCTVLVCLRWPNLGKGSFNQGMCYKLSSQHAL